MGVTIQPSILSSATPRGARIEGCESAEIYGPHRTLRYGFHSVQAYSGCYPFRL